MRDKEYDRFGPWALEISEDDPVPPLFAPHVDAQATPLLSFKIPRSIERRRAHPGMHLYNYLVSLYEDEIEILERDEERVIPHRFTYDALKALRLTDDLLHGTVALILAERSFEFTYNTVSEEIVRRMARLLRERIVRRMKTSVELYDAALDGTTLGEHFSRLLTMEQRRELDHRLLAGQGQAGVATDDNALRRFWYGVLDKHVCESIHLSDGRELKLIGRGRVYRYRWQAGYAVDTLYVPFDSIDSFSYVPDPTQPDVNLLTVTIGTVQTVYGAERDSPTFARLAGFLKTATVS